MKEFFDKMSKKKKIELLIIVLVLIWVFSFLIDYVRYVNSKPPILALHMTLKYEDGVTEEYYKIGYVYRIYNRESISGDEFVPFWSHRKGLSIRNGIPETYSDYNVPNNNEKKIKYRGLLYFFDNKRGSLLGTYKCINSLTDCDYAKNGKDIYDIDNKDVFVKKKATYLEIINNNFVFIDDSKNQFGEEENPNYVKTIYLYNIKYNRIIARFGDVKGFVNDSYEEYYHGDEDKYIVKDFDSGKWGLIKILEDGTYKEVLPFEYDSINYDVDTNYYILSKKNKWSVKDLKYDKVILKDQENVIYDVWINFNKTTYFKYGNILDDNNVNYSVYRGNGISFLSESNICALKFYSKFIMYIKCDDKKLKFIDYSGKINKTISLYFTEFYDTKDKHSAIEIDKEREDELTFNIYKSSIYNSECDYDYYDYNEYHDKY